MLGFWIFMFIVTLIIPVTMIIFGSRFIKKPPKDINAVYGYRTTMSMKNMETWTFAHYLVGRIWRTLGWVMLGIVIAVMIPFLNGDIETVGKLGASLSIAQLVPMFISIIPVEVALKRNFNNNGLRKM